jgi:hypothetical protein
VPAEIEVLPPSQVLTRRQGPPLRRVSMPQTKQKLVVGQVVHTQDPAELITGNTPGGPFLARRAGCSLLIQTDRAGIITSLRTAPENYEVMAPSQGPSMQWEVSRLADEAGSYQEPHVG